MDFSVHWRVSKEQQNVSSNILKDFFFSKIRVKDQVKEKSINQNPFVLHKTGFLRFEIILNFYNRMKVDLKSNNFLHNRNLVSSIYWWKGLYF